MDVYIKPDKKASVIKRKVVYLKDVADVFSPSGKLENIKNIILLKITEDKKKSYLISIVDIFKAINKSFPDANVTNLGEMDTIVEYIPEKKKPGKIITILKVSVSFFIMFFGGSTAIMGFHSDAQIPKIFENYYYIFMGERTITPYILTIPYSIGIAFGIIFFFNHFSKKFLTTDPTPIEVQMTTYEKEVNDNVIDTLERENKKEQGK
ncbi:MAG: stage V sporulation protein AA [Lachnospiraceae bacterium]|nr:stage V sporulation protein AA [Lachnospiraceae bacterium]